YFTCGMSTLLAQQKLKPGKHFKSFTDALEACEQEPTDANLDALEETARDYLRHFHEDFDSKDQNDKYNNLKMQVCAKALDSSGLKRCYDQLQALGPPDDWGQAEESQAAALYAKLLFETGGERASPLSKEQGGVQGSWWVEKQVGNNDNKKKF